MTGVYVLKHGATSDALTQQLRGLYGLRTGNANMLKRDEIADPNSCLNKADDKEPLFVLRANDENAPAAVTAWARDYIISKGGWGAMSDNQKKKYGEAMDIAGEMRIWQMHQHKRAHR